MESKTKQNYMEPKKLKPEELEKVKTFEASISQQLQELGVASYDEVAARNRVVSITERLTETAQQKNEYYTELTQMYGDGTIDLSEGSFIPTPSKPTED